MPHDTRTNGHAMDEMPPKPPGKLSETEFLALEADSARAAMSQTMDEMRTSLKDAADVRAWAKTYPWATLGAAAAAGFVAAVALSPKRQTSDETAEPALLERILADEQIAARIKELAEEDATCSRRPGTLQSVASTLFRTFGPAIQSAVASALAAKAAAPDAEDIADAACQGDQPPDSQEPAEPS